MNISRTQLTELRELLEDTIEYFCDDQVRANAPVSGEAVWTCVEVLGTAKVAELQDKMTVNDLIAKLNA